MILTAEITVSKLFPAGFGWQAGSVVGVNLGFQATEIPFWLLTGVGDLLGVFFGSHGLHGYQKIDISE